MNNDLVKISQEIVSNIERIDDFVDSYFDPIKDITDTTKDLFTPIKILHSLYTYNKKRKFKIFLKYFAESLNTQDIQSVETSQKMQKYLLDEKNFNFINETIEGAINSKSIYGSMLLGYLAGRILNGIQIITYKELIILEALRNLNDFELSYFTKIYSVADLANEINIYQLKDKLGSPFPYEITIIKLLQLRVVDEAPIIISDNQKGRFNSNEIAEEIYEMIQSSGIEKELINYQY